MIKIENTEVMGFKAAIRGMRNPMNSHERSDSYFDCSTCFCKDCLYIAKDPCGPQALCIGENDLALMKKLCEAGTDHRKFMRMITVYLDITAPLYW